MAENATSNKIGFYKPIKRFLIPINDFHLPKKLFKEFKKQDFIITLNNDFQQVINNCALPRKKNEDTWINEIIKNSYIQLNKLDLAHSIECWKENTKS